MHRILVKPALGGTTAAAILMLLAGCANDPLTMMGIPPLQPRVAKTATAGPPEGVASQAPAAGGEVCKSAEFVAPVDVDTAYARVMSRLRFRTLAERGGSYSRVSDSGFRYTAQPGAYYKMADYVRFTDPVGAPAATWMTMEIVKDGPSRSKIKSGHCEAPRDPGYNDPRYDEMVTRTMREAVLQ